MAVEAASGTMAQAGKYLSFQLGDEEYGLEILKVQEIIGIMNITRVPKTPDAVRGVINLRGKVIPVIDLRLKFELPPTEDTERTCIIVVQVARKDDNITMGIIVDEVSEVLDIDQEKIEETPEMGAGVEKDFILGMGKIEEKVIMLLDIDRVLSGQEVEAVSQAAAAA